MSGESQRQGPLGSHEPLQASPLSHLAGEAWTLNPAEITHTLPLARSPSPYGHPPACFSLEGSEERKWEPPSPLSTETPQAPFAESGAGVRVP